MIAETDAMAPLPVLERASAIQASESLLQRAREYLAIVDSGDPTRQGEERTAAHEALMDAMQAERIPFNARWEARWVARWLVSGGFVYAGKYMTIMFAQAPARYEDGEYDPVRDGVLNLTCFPYRTEDEERKNFARYVPVLVTVEPLRDYDGATYERNE